MDLRERIAKLMNQVRPELAELVAIPSVADPRLFPPDECVRAARWVRDAFAGAGFSDARLAEMADGSQAVLGSRPGPDPDAPTVLLYAHYDVQPPLNEADWRTPPFELTEAGGRWYGRGAADCKGNIMMHLTALRALGEAVPVNLKLVVEGSEETTGALRPQRERGSGRDSGDGPDRGAVPATLRRKLSLGRGSACDPGRAPTSVTAAPCVSGSYGVNVPFMQLQRHDWDIHAVSREPGL